MNGRFHAGAVYITAVSTEDVIDTREVFNEEEEVDKIMMNVDDTADEDDEAESDSSDTASGKCDPNPHLRRSSMRCRRSEGRQPDLTVRRSYAVWSTARKTCQSATHTVSKPRGNFGLPPKIMKLIGSCNRCAL